MTTFPKTCGCGRVYSSADWSRLPLVGHQDSGDRSVLELRNCPCRSTISIEMGEGAEPIVCSCRRCGRVEECRVWRGLQVCVECEYILGDWAENLEWGARAYIRRAELSRAS